MTTGETPSTTTTTDTNVPLGLAHLLRLSLRQRSSAMGLYRIILFWAQWVIWVLGFAYILSQFYFSRPLANWILGVSIRGTVGGRVWQRGLTIANTIRGWLRALIPMVLGVAVLYDLHQLGSFTRPLTIFAGFLSFALLLAFPKFIEGPHHRQLGGKRWSSGDKAQEFGR
jgi:hypothetical protein